MNASPAELKRQYNRAKKLLWVEHFREAANTVVPNLFDTADLMAIGSRESNLDPVWLTKPGDKGNGFGPMQADKRSFPEWIKTGQWRDPRESILKGAEILKQKWDDVQTNAGKRLSVTDRKGNRYTFTGPHVSGLTAQQIAIAAYNSGRWAAYHYTKGRHPDHGTTGKDYSADVMARARVFRELLGKDGMLDSAATPAVNTLSERTKDDSKLPPSQAAADNTETPTSGEITAKTQTTTSTGSTSVEVTTTQNVVVEKKEGWFRRKWKEIVGLVSGNSLLDGWSERLAQVQALGLPPRFWTNLIYFTVAGGLIYLAFDWYRDYQDRKLTHKLIDANSTPTNMVQVATTSTIDDFHADPDWQVIKKG